MNCYSCQASVKSGWEFCNKCGQSIVGDARVPNSKRFENENGWLEYGNQILRAQIGAVIQLDKTMKTLGGIANLGGNQFEKLLENAGNQGVVAIPLASVISVQAKAPKADLVSGIGGLGKFKTNIPGFISIASTSGKAINLVIQNEVEFSAAQVFAKHLELAISAASQTAIRPQTVLAVQAPEPADLKSCPECAEDIRLAAIKCRYCGYRYP